MSSTTEQGREPATDPARRRGMIIVGSFVLFISIGSFFRVPLLPTIGADLAMSAGSLGLITTAFALGRLATDIPAGRMADRVPPLRSLGVAGLALAAGSLGVAAAPVGAYVIGAAVVLGVGSSIANTTGMTYFSTAAPPARRGMAMAYFSAALLGGQSFGPAIGGALADVAGWRTAITSAAGMGAVILVLSLVGRRLRSLHDLAGVPRSRRQAESDPEEGGVGQPPGVGGSPPATDSVPPAIPKGQAWMLYGVSFGSFFMLGSMPQTLVPIIGDDRLMLTAGAIGLALGLGGVCRFVGALVGGRVADRVSRKRAIVPGLLLCATGVAILAADLGLQGYIAAIVLLSLGSYTVSTGATMLADHAGGQNVGSQLGKYRFVGDLGLLAGPALSGIIYERVGPAAAVLTVAALLACIALACAIGLRETRWLHQVRSDEPDQPDLPASSTTRPEAHP